NPGTVGDGENITIGASPTGQGQPDQVVSPPPAPVATPSTDVQPSVVAASQPVAPEIGAAASAGVSGMDTSTSTEVTTTQASPQSVPQPNPVPAVGAPAPNISSPQPVVAAPPDPGVAPVSPPPEHTTVVHAGGVDTLPAPADGGNKKKL